MQINIYKSSWTIQVWLTLIGLILFWIICCAIILSGENNISNLIAFSAVTAIFSLTYIYLLTEKTYLEINNGELRYVSLLFYKKRIKIEDIRTITINPPHLMEVACENNKTIKKQKIFIVTFDKPVINKLLIDLKNLNPNITS